MPPSRRRIARETLEIYAPIAQRLGMNKFKAELQDLGFRALYPDRHRVISERIRAALGNRREAMGKIESGAVDAPRPRKALPHRVVGRIKSPYSIYTKMRAEHKTLRAGDGRVRLPRGRRSRRCSAIMALGAVHALYKPLDRALQDFIAIPKANGYQSLHTVLFGPFGAPIEVQIRTEDMDQIAERGVAAHWAYKTDARPGEQRAGACARVAFQRWLDSAGNTASSAGVPRERQDRPVPRRGLSVHAASGDILALPRNATALDFAYAVHTDVGDHAVAARVDKKLVPLRTRLDSGQLVEIITAPSAVPQSGMAGIGGYRQGAYRDPPVPQASAARGCRGLRSSHARSRARCARHSVSTRFRRRRWIVSWTTSKLKRLEELLSDIALGNRMPDQVASAAGWRHAARARAVPQSRMQCRENPHHRRRARRAEFRQLLPSAAGRRDHRLPSSGKGIVVHRVECPNVAELRKSPERCVAIEWDRDVQGDYRAELRIEVINRPGVLATVAAAIAEADSNIENVEYVGARCCGRDAAVRAWK